MIIGRSWVLFHKKRPTVCSRPFLSNKDTYSITSLWVMVLVAVSTLTK